MITYKGNTTPKVGDDEWYELSATTLPEDTEIHWRLFREVDGEWIKVDFEDIGRKIRLEFSQKALGERFLLRAYTAKGERLTLEGLEIIPSKGEAKITDLLIRDSSKKATKETYGFGEQITVCVKAIDMQGEEVTLQIWDKKVGTEAPKEVPLWEGKGKIPLKGVLWFENITLMDVTAMFLGKEKNYYLTLSIDGKIIDAKKNTLLTLKGFQINEPSLGISPVLVGTPDRDFSLKSEEERTIEYTIELFDHKNNPIAKLKDTDDIYYQEKFKITVKPDRKIEKKVLFLNIKDSKGERIANNLEAKWEEKTERFECNFIFPLSAYNEKDEEYVEEYKTVNNKLKKFELDIEDTLKIKNANGEKENKYIIIPFTYKRNYEELIGRRLALLSNKSCEDHYIENGEYKSISSVVDDFIKELNDNSGNFNNFVAKKATELWKAAVADSHKSNKYSNIDDRSLYWARIKMQVALKRHPAFKNDIDHNKSKIKEGSKLEKIIRIFEKNSRNYKISFSEAGNKKRVLVTGFDPFSLNNNIYRSNPSGVCALAFNKTIIGDYFIQTCIFPVRYEDFDQGCVEEVVSDLIAKKEVDFIISLSLNGSWYHFDIERFAAKNRGGGQDNMNIGIDNEKYDKSRFKNNEIIGKEFYETTLPVNKIITDEIASHFDVKKQVFFYDQSYESTTGVEKSVPKKISDILGEKTILDEEDIKVANIHNKNENCIDITPEGKSIRGSGGNYLSNEIFYRIARVRDKNFSNIKTGHIHIANPKEDAYIPDLLKITIRLFDREEIIEEIKKMLERCFTK